MVGFFLFKTYMIEIKPNLFYELKLPHWDIGQDFLEK